MPRAGFGQVGDLSGLFSSLYAEDIANRERLARDLEQRNDERQAAKDSEMFSKYEHGDISGAEILAYIRSRVANSQHDPEEHAKWKDALRDYEQSISDQNAEDAYANGGSVHALIQYYRERKRSVEKGTPVYSEVSRRLNELIDESAGDDLFAGEQRIMDQIQAGKASYGDLAAFYRKQLKGLRPNSPLRDDVLSRLDQAEDTIVQQRSESEIAKIDFQYKSGAISANEANRRMTAAASVYRASDPARYWSLLETGNGYLIDAQNKAAAAFAEATQDMIPNPGALGAFGTITQPRPPVLGGNNTIVNHGRGYSSSPSSSAEAMIAAAWNYRGTPYRLGQESFKGIDCSGLIFRAFEDANLGDLINGDRKKAAGYQRHFASQGQFTRDMSDVRRGDLVMYDNGSHIGIYLGNGKVLSSLTGAGPTVHSLNGISTNVTGFLVVDWSKSKNAPSAPPRRPSRPARPGRNYNNRPDVDERPQSNTEPLPAQDPAERPQGPSRTNKDGTRIPYQMHLPSTETEVREQIQLIGSMEDRALAMADAFERGDPFFDIGNERIPLTEQTVRAALGEAYQSNDYKAALSFSINDSSGANNAYTGRSVLAGKMLQFGDQRQQVFLENILNDANKSFQYSDRFDLDPNRALGVVYNVIDRLTQFNKSLRPGDALSDKGVTQGFDTDIDKLLGALQVASNPDTDDATRETVISTLPPELRPFVSGAGQVAKTVAEVNSGQSVITVINGEFTTAPARQEMLPSGQPAMVPNIPGVTRSQMVPVLIKRNGQTETIWVMPDASPVVNQSLNQLTVTGVNPAALLGFNLSVKTDASGKPLTAPRPLAEGTVVTSQMLADIKPADVHRLIASGALEERPMLFKSVVLPAHDPDGPQQYVPTIGPEGRKSAVLVGTKPLVEESRWYQDPETLQWYKDRLPISNAQPDGYGGVHTESDEMGNPRASIVWRQTPGVPVISVADPKSTQEAFNNGELAGLMPPPMFRDAYGDVSYDPVDMPDPSLVYDKSQEAYMASQAYRSFREGERAIPKPPPMASGSAFAGPGALDPFAGAPILFGSGQPTPSYSGRNLGTLTSPARQILDQFLGTQAFRDFRAGERAAPSIPPPPSVSKTAMYKPPRTTIPAPTRARPGTAARPVYSPPAAPRPVATPGKSLTPSWYGSKTIPKPKYAGVNPNEV